MPRTDETTAPDADEQTLLQAVQQALQRLPWHLGFAPALEARMEADLGPERRRLLVMAGLVTLLIFDLFLINDWLVRPEVFGVALVCRLGFTLYGLALLVLIHRGIPARWREGLMASAVVVAMAASGEIFRQTRSAGGAHDPFVFGLVFMAGNIVLALRFVPALVSSVLAVGVCVPLVRSNPLLPPDAQGFAFALLAATSVFTCLACYRLERAARQSYLVLLQEALRSQSVQRLADRYAHDSQTDALTGLANRRVFDEALMQAWLSAPGRADPAGLLVVDVDHFKAFNDHFGHPAGDACLRQVAQALLNALRGDDLIARIGGEEFAVLLCPTGPEALAAAAERLCRAVQALALPHDGEAGRSVVTVSVGAALGRHDVWDRPAALMEAADQALYAAKRGGRNRWRVAGDAEPA